MKKVKKKPKEATPLLTNKDPGYRGAKHIRAIQNPEGWFR